MSEIIQQGTDEWRQQRLGKVTASRIADMMAKTKSGWGASRGNYMAQIIAERLTGIAPDNYTNAAMQWGTETEPLARAAYEFMTDIAVTEIGFVDHLTIAMAGASPDGLAGADGLVEIKCPLTATHIETLLSGAVPGKYRKQMQFQMACTGRAWCDFVSFDPRMPEDMQLFITRLHRDDDEIAEIEAAVVEFLAEVDAKIDALTAAVRRAA